MVCPAAGQGGVRGKLTRLVLTGGKAIWMDVEPDHELKPGRWSVDLFLPIPATATTGAYEFEVSFETSSVVFQDRKSFTVIIGR